MSENLVPSNVKNLIGNRYKKLTVESFAYTKGGKAYWLCKCDCGNSKVIAGRHLTEGHTKSCGCVRIAENKSRAKHNMSNTKLYNVYRGIMKRCYNSNNASYKNYGGRGIKVCDKWKDGEKGSTNFLEWSLANGYKESLQIDRIDVNGNYEPSNCRWVTAKVNSNNKRNNIPITINGITKNLYQWQKTSGIRYQTIKDRLDRGITGTDLLKETKGVKLDTKNTKEEIYAKSQQHRVGV